MNNRPFKLVGIAVGGFLAFTGGSRTEPHPAYRSARQGRQIGVIAPLSGDLSALGIRNSVDLAIRQANDAGTIPGWKLGRRPRTTKPSRYR